MPALPKRPYTLKIDPELLDALREIKERDGIVDNTLPPRTRELLGLPPSTMPVLQTLTVRQLLDVYRERHIDHTITKENQAYQIGTITRTVLPRPDGTSAPFGDWIVTDVT